MNKNECPYTDRKCSNHAQCTKLCPRWLVRYVFAGSEEIIGVYRNAPTLHEAFTAEAEMWKFWSKKIIFVEGFKIHEYKEA